MIVLEKTNSKHLAEVYDFLNPNQVLICMFDCTVGVAEKGTKGYTKTNYKIDTPRYDEAKKTVAEANNIIHPNKTALDIGKIELSTF